MRSLLAVPFLVIVALSFGQTGAEAQSYAGGPSVIAAPSYVHDVERTGPPAPQWQPAEQYSSSDLGGGLIQFLATGGAPTRSAAPQVGYYDPRAQLYNAPQPAQSARMAYALPQSQPQAYQQPVQSQPDPKYRRQEVAYDGHERPGTIVIDSPNKFLYLVEPDHRALRYGIGVGRPGFEWAGVKTITRKAEWPDWTPPSEMLKRRPDLPAHMDGGPANPLGARAMYLGSSLYRIHGTNEPDTIGTNVSSGCIRLLNEDVIDLYGRVKVGTRVVVM